MENEYVVVKKGPSIWKIIGIILAIAGICFIGYKIYTKYFRKKADVIDAGDELPELDDADILSDEDVFEVDAASVISNAADMGAEG